MDPKRAISPPDGSLPSFGAGNFPKPATRLTRVSSRTAPALAATAVGAGFLIPRPHSPPCTDRCFPATMSLHSKALRRKLTCRPKRTAVARRAAN